MLAKDFIINNLPVLNLTDSCDYALVLMEDFKLKNLPLVDNGVYKQLISEKDLLSASEICLVKDLNLQPLFASVSKDTHILDLLSLMSHYDISLVPIVENEIYCGAVTREMIVGKLAEILGANEEGSIIVVDLHSKDYQLSEIVRIVESNNARIISMTTHYGNKSDWLKLSLKINLEDPSPLIRSFERFNYSVITYSKRKNVIREQLQQKIEEVLYYINL